MKNVIIFLVLAVLSVSLYARIENPDKPLKGKWDFQMKKIWEVEEAGKDILGEVQNLGAANDGRVYVADSKNQKIFIYSKEGKFISSFGPRGEGPGEIKKYGSGDQLFVVNNTVIFADLDKIHYFTLDGRYQKTAIIPSNLKPRSFVSENTFISAPAAINPESNGGKTAKIMLYNIKEQSKKIISEFQPYEKASASQVSGRRRTTVTVIIHSITPMIFLSYRDSRIYYGMSNLYKIDIVSLKGEKIPGFSLENRKRKDVSQKYKDDLAKELSGAPEDIIRKIIAGLPEKASFYQDIEIDKNGLIYLYVSDPSNEAFQAIDIFSPKGRYLYSSEIRAGEGLSIKEGYLYFKDDCLLLPAEDEEGNLKVIKYSIILPVL